MKAGVIACLAGVAAMLYGIFGNTEVVANAFGQYGPGVDEGFAVMFIVFGALLSATGISVFRQ